MMWNNTAIEAIFESYHKRKELEDYKQDKMENERILQSNPFDEEKARQQISKIVNKYSFEINAMASISGNGRTTTNQVIHKTSQELWNDLAYLDNNLLRFMLEHEGLSSLLKEVAKGSIQI